MKIIQNALSDELIHQCIHDLDCIKSERIWGSSLINWHKTILQNVTGSCLVTDIKNEELMDKLEEELNPILPYSEKIHFQYYIWQKNSAISAHTDESYKFGATIYLNKEWDINYGGLFIWEEKRTKKLNAVVPKFNQLVLNGTGELHLVTPIGFNVPTDRYTIQIWGQ